MQLFLIGQWHDVLACGLLRASSHCGKVVAKRAEAIQEEWNETEEEKCKHYRKFCDRMKPDLVSNLLMLGQDLKA